ARLRFHEQVEPLGVGRRHGEIALADESAGETAARLAEGHAAVGALVEAAFARAGDDRPRLALDARHPGVHGVRVAGLEFDVGGAGAVVEIQRLAPGAAAVRRAEDAALGVALEHVAGGGNPRGVGIGGMHTQRADLPGVVETGEVPGLAAVGAAVHAAARGDVAARAVGAGADPDHVGIAVGHGDRADRCDGDLAVGDRLP